MRITTGSNTGRVFAQHDAAGSAPSIDLRDVVGSLAWGGARGSYPVLDLLSRNLTFFTAHQAIPFDVFGLALLLTVVIPVVVALPVVILMRLAPRSASSPMRRSLAFSPAASLPFVERHRHPVARIALALGWETWSSRLASDRALQTMLRWGAAVPVVVLAFFVFASPASALIIPPDKVVQETSVAGNPVPVVVCAR